MRWRKMRRSSNVDDRRSGGRSGGMFRMPTRGLPRSSRVRRAGGGSIGFLLLLVIGAWLLGINPMTLLGGGSSINSGGSLPGGQMTATRSSQNDEKSEFIARVLGDTEDVWKKVFTTYNMTYEEPTLVLFSGQVRSACGFASAASGPFYCPGDRKVYIDLSFYDELRRRFEAPGDFAQAYVVAHEIGHHVQNMIGVLPKFNQMRQRMSKAEANKMSIRVELQADCFAGVWGHYTDQRNLLEQGDIEEAMNAAMQIGDDAIQRRTQGYVVPESFNHGSSQQRSRWFKRGLESGKLEACDTFNVANP